eukprot:1137379-Rhodomonas_salina.2
MRAAVLRPRAPGTSTVQISVPVPPAIQKSSTRHPTRTGIAVSAMPPCQHVRTEHRLLPY